MSLHSSAIYGVSIVMASVCTRDYAEGPPADEVSLHLLTEGMPKASEDVV